MASRTPVYAGRFGPAKAERLLWRAGFGPRRGEAARLAKVGLRGAVHSLTRPPAVKLVGPSRRSVKQGHAIVELVNLGEDPHNLALRRNAKGARTYRTRVVRPEGQTSISLRLYPGRYTLWCTVGDHRHHGMVATLTVRR